MEVLNTYVVGEKKNGITAFDRIYHMSNRRSGGSRYAYSLVYHDGMLHHRDIQTSA